MISNDDAKAWRQWLEEWDRKVYKPIFEPKQISRNTALMLWVTFAKPMPVLTGDDSTL